MNFAIHEVPTPDEGEPHPLVHALVDVDRRAHLDMYGHDDFHEGLAGALVGLVPTEYYVTRRWVALPAGVAPEACRPSDAVGHAELCLGLKEELDVGDVFVAVTRPHRNQGIGQALYDRVLEGLGTRSVQRTWCDSPSLAPHEDGAVTAKSGHGTIDGRSPEAAWLAHRGFDLEQTEVYSRLDLDRSKLPDTLARLSGDAAAQAGPDYELVAWVGRAPDAMFDDLGDLLRRFSTDQPSAGLEQEEAVYDADRVRTTEDRIAARGHHRARVAARHVPSGKLVALTELSWPERNPAGVWQNVTIVDGAHRGHRLGLWTKATNLGLLLDANPDAARVHTWNADENTHMLAINRHLGFERLGLEGAWQRKGAHP